VTQDAEPAIGINAVQLTAAGQEDAVLGSVAPEFPWPDDSTAAALWAK
jgi:hypothetical protein